jgi:hypothetical protein
MRNFFVPVFELNSHVNVLGVIGTMLPKACTDEIAGYHDASEATAEYSKATSREAHAIYAWPKLCGRAA